MNPVAIRTIAPVALTTFEKTYRADHQNEHAVLYSAHGELIVRRTGEIDEVKFSEQELNRACFGTLDHNHPRAMPPSGDDLALAARYGLTLKAVGITPEGKAVDYTVTMPGPSETLAEQLKAAFDNEVERAEQELANQPLDDRAWQREARHLAVSRLSFRYGFGYMRTQRKAPVGEMSHEVKRLDILADVDPLIEREVLTPLRISLVAALTRNANAQGRVPIERMTSVRNSAAQIVQHVMLGKPQQDGALKPYHTRSGEPVPNSAYFAALLTLMRRAAQVAADYHAGLMRRYLPDDLKRLYEFATIDPFGGRVVEEMDVVEGFSPLEYDPLHEWLGPDNKRLSDRIWNATGDMRRRLDEYLASAITRGTPVSQMAQELQQFLLSGNGSYEAMRLAHTETTAAFHRADSAAAQLNPFVETYNFMTAPQHKCCDECDNVEAGSPYDKDDLLHLPPRHPFCVCRVFWNVVSDIKAVVIKLRQSIEQAIGAARKAASDFIGPLSRRFVDLLFRTRG